MPSVLGLCSFSVLSGKEVTILAVQFDITNTPQEEIVSQLICSSCGTPRTHVIMGNLITIAACQKCAIEKGFPAVSWDWVKSQMSDYDNRKDKSDERGFCRGYRCNYPMVTDQHDACQCQLLQDNTWNGRCAYQG